MKSVGRLPKRGERHSLLPWLAAGLGLFVARNGFAKDYYVAATGSDSNAGTIDQPFATLQKGADTAIAGDTVYIRGGTYAISGQGFSGTAGIQISKSGTSDTTRIKFWAYQGEVPVFDFAKTTMSSSQQSSGIHVTGNYLHFKGLEICNVQMPGGQSNNGMWAEKSSNNIFELMNFHHNSGAGFFIGHGNGGHLILNCDSHDNYDAKSSAGAGQNADGFGAHYQDSPNSVPITYRGCRAWYNSDDGWDLFRQYEPVLVENSWAMGSGYINSGAATAPQGNGAGFKMGNNFTAGVRHTIRNCVSWKNKSQGFYANHSYSGTDWYNNTSYNNNGAAFDMLSDMTLSGNMVHVLRNNIAFPAKINNIGASDAKNNTWNLSITPAASDFLSVSDTDFTGPRQADGSLPNLNFMKLAAGSQMIDQGVDVGIPFVGANPDLGAYEFGATGAGGTPGTAGASGNGGATGAGGRSGSGGATAGGGAAGAGGRSGAGGSTAGGGAAGSGGRVETGGTATGGGAPGSGGIGAVGGAPGGGSTAVSGGRIGSSGTGGVANTGGGVGTGDSGVANGGSSESSAATDSGGVSASGGVASTSSPAEVGGSLATGGTAGTDVTGGTSTATGTTEASSGGGCSCRLVGARTTSLQGLALLALLMVAVRRRSVL